MIKQAFPSEGKVSKTLFRNIQYKANIYIFIGDAACYPLLANDKLHFNSAG